MDIQLILTHSIAFDLIAALLIIRLGRITGKTLICSLLSLAILVMAIRRSIVLFKILSGTLVIPPCLEGELIGLGIMLLMIIGILGITPVLTTVRRSQMALKIIEDRYKALTEAAHDAIFIIDQSGLIQYINDYASKLLHKPSEQIIGHAMNKFFPPKIAERHWLSIKKVLETGKPIYAEDTESFENQEIWLGTWLTPLKNATGKIDSVMGISRNISERIKSEHVLRAERDRAQSYLDIASAFFIAIDHKQTVTMINKRGCEILGYSEDEIIGKNWFESFVPERMRHGVRGIFKRLVSKEIEPYEYVENPVLTKNGGERIIAWHNAPLKDEFGNITGTLSYGQDITERKKAEEQILFQASLLNQVRNAIIVTDTEGKIIYWNKYSETLFQWKTKEVIGRKILNFISSTPIQNKLKEITEEIKIRGHWEGEFEVPKKDGQISDIYLICTTLKDALGQIKGIIGITIDITERKKAEEAIKRSEEKYYSLMEGAGDAIIIADENGHFLDSNKKAQELLKYTKEELLQLSVPQIHPKEEMDIISSAFQKIVESGHEKTLNVHVVAKDQSLIPVDITSSKIEFSGKTVYQGIFRDISDRKKAETDLRESEERYRSLVQTAPDVIFSISMNGTISSLNPAFEKITGWALKEWLDKPFTEILHPDDRLAGLKLFQTILKGASASPTELRFRSQCGEYLVGEVTTAAQLNNGKIIGTFGIIRDVTERKKNQEALLERFEQLQVVYHLRDAVGRSETIDEIYEEAISAIQQALKTDRASILLFDSEGMMRFKAWTGLSENYRKAVNGHSPWSPKDTHAKPILIPDIEEDKTLGHLKETILQEGIHALAFIPLSYQGQLVGKIMTYYNQPHLFTMEELDLVHTIASHVAFATERKRAIDALQKSEANNRALLNALPDIVFRLKKDGTFIDVKSPKDEELMYPPDQIIGKKVLDLMPQNLGHQIMRNIEKALKTNEIQIFEYQITLKGNPQDYEARIVANGTEEVCVIVRNITERKKIDRMKNEFISTVSHELRTPLTSIRSSLSLIAGGYTGDLTPKTKAMADIANKSCDRLGRLINDILDIEKIEFGKTVFKIKPVELCTLIENTIEASRSLAEQSGVKLIFNDKILGARVNSDSDRITQVMMNLLSNAIKYSPSKDFVTISMTRNNLYIRVSITDHGPGIPDEFKERIFQKFAQADSTVTRQKGGTGLGLSISKAIIEKLGGHIYFDIHQNQGTTFYFELLELRS